MPPTDQPSQFGEARTVETHLLQRTSRISSNTSRLAPPAPLFAAAILPGAAAAAPSSAPLLPPPARGYRRGGGATGLPSVYSPTVPALLARASSGVPRQPGEISNRDLAPKKKKKTFARGREAGPVGWGAGPSGGGATRGSVCFPPPALEQGAGS